MDRRSFIAALLGITAATVAGAGAALAQRGRGGFGARFSARMQRRRERRAARRARRAARRAARRGM